MGKFLKKFSVDSDYQSYINGSDAVLPNVSICVEEEHVHYNPFVEPIIGVIKLVYEIPQVGASQNVMFAQGWGSFDPELLNFIKVDDVDFPIENFVHTEGGGWYIPMTENAEHTVEFSYDDGTSLPRNLNLGVTYLKEVHIGTGIENIESQAFTAGDNYVEYAEVPSTLVSCDKYCNFPTGVSSARTNYDIVLEDSSMYGIPSVVYSVGGGVSYRYRILSLKDKNGNDIDTAHLVIKEGVTGITNYTYQYDADLRTVVIASTVTTIGSSAFYQDSGLTAITCLALVPPTLEGSYTFDDTNNCSIYVPFESVDTYKAAAGWSKYASRIFDIPA